jgi:hypothetical protein
VHDVLAAHQRAVDARIEEGLREIRLAVSNAVGRAIDPPPMEVEAPRPEGPATDDVVRSLVSHTEERFQALSLRLRRIEDVLRQVAKREGPDVDVQIEGLRRSITSIAATQQQELARLIEAQRRGTAQLRRDVRSYAEALRRDHRSSAEALAKHQRATAEVVTSELRAAVEQMGARVGRGVAAIAKQLREDLAARQDALVERSLRGLAAELRRQGGLRSEARREPRDIAPTPTPAPQAETTPAPRPDPAPAEARPEPNPEPRRYLIERKQQPVEEPPVFGHGIGSEPGRT